MPVKVTSPIISKSSAKIICPVPFVRNSKSALVSVVVIKFVSMSILLVLILSVVSVPFITVSPFIVTLLFVVVGPLITRLPFTIPDVFIVSTSVSVESASIFVTLIVFRLLMLLLFISKLPVIAAEPSSINTPGPGPPGTELPF